MSIYVEIFIRGDMDELWQETQELAIHQRWDLRFSEIKYLPRGEGKPQEFLCSTRIACALAVPSSLPSVALCLRKPQKDHACDRFTDGRWGAASESVRNLLNP